MSVHLHVNWNGGREGRGEEGREGGGGAGHESKALRGRATLVPAHHSLVEQLAFVFNRSFHVEERKTSSKSARKTQLIK